MFRAIRKGTIPFYEVLVRNEIYFVGKEIIFFKNEFFFVLDDIKFFTNEINFVTHEINVFINEKYDVKSTFYLSILK